MKNALRPVVGLALAFVAVGGPLAAPASARSCFLVRYARSPLRSVDGHTVYLRVGPHVWALEVFNRCPDVDRAPRTALRSPAARICEGRPRDVRIHVRSPERVNQRCAVSSVRRLTAEEAAALASKIGAF